MRCANSFIDGSERCLRVDGGSRALLGTDLTFEGVSFACAQTHDRDDDGAVKSYLDSAPNVSQNGEKVDPVSLSDTFFDNTDFIGAFGAENWAAGWTYAGSVSHSSQPDFGCPDGTTTSSRMLNGTRVCQLSGTITNDLLLTSSNYYELVGKVVVGGDNEASADLTVQAGTTIFGGTDVDFLVISRGSKIIANGNRTAPVTLTSQSGSSPGGANLRLRPRPLGWLGHQRQRADQRLPGGRIRWQRSTARRRAKPIPDSSAATSPMTPAGC